MIPSFFTSLSAARYASQSIFVVDTHREIEESKALTSIIEIYRTLLKMDIRYVDIRYPTTERDAGYGITNIVIDHVLKNEKQCQYFVITNGDRIYIRISG